MSKAEAILNALEAAREKALSDRRSQAAYWNGDDWGSNSGQRDANEWVRKQLIEAIEKELK